VALKEFYSLIVLSIHFIFVRQLQAFFFHLMCAARLGFMFCVDVGTNSSYITVQR